MRSRRLTGSLAVAAVVVAGACGGGGSASDAGTDADHAADLVPGGDGSGGAVDCPATCAGIATICDGMSTIAVLEQACVQAAVDCATAVLCAVDPIGARG